MTAQRRSPGCGERGREATLDVTVHGAPLGLDLTNGVLVTLGT